MPLHVHVPGLAWECGGGYLLHPISCLLDMCFSFMARAAELADTLTHIKVSVLSRERLEVSRVCVAVVRG